MIERGGELEDTAQLDRSHTSQEKVHSSQTRGTPLYMSITRDKNTSRKSKDVRNILGMNDQTPPSPDTTGGE